MNKVVLVGRLTKDPELRYAPGSGVPTCRFTVAVNRMKKDEADFINCVAFNKTAELIAQYLGKGRQIAISGSIRTGSYTAQDGSKRYTTDVVVETFDFIDSNSGNRNNIQSDFEAPSNNDFGSGAIDDDITPVDDGDMPF